MLGTRTIYYCRHATLSRNDTRPCPPLYVCPDVFPPRDAHGRVHRESPSGSARKMARGPEEPSTSPACLARRGRSSPSSGSITTPWKRAMKQGWPPGIYIHTAAKSQRRVFVRYIAKASTLRTYRHSLCTQGLCAWDSDRRYVHRYIRRFTTALALAFSPPPRRYMATAGFLSPRMKEREKLKTRRTEKLLAAEEVCQNNIQTLRKISSDKVHDNIMASGNM